MSKWEGLFIKFVFCATAPAEPSWADSGLLYELRIGPGQMSDSWLLCAVQTIINQHARIFDSVCATFYAEAELLNSCGLDGMMDGVVSAMKALGSAANRKPIDYMGIHVGEMEIAQAWKLMCKLPTRIVSLEIDTCANVKGAMPACVSRRMKHLCEMRCMNKGRLIKTYSVCGL